MSAVRAQWLAGVMGVSLFTVGAIIAIQMGMSAVGSALAAVSGVIAAGALWLMYITCVKHESESQKQKNELAELRAASDRHRALAVSIVESYPFVVSLVSPEGSIELSNSAATRCGLSQGKSIAELPDWFKDLVQSGGSLVDGKRDSVRMSANGEERYFTPTAATLRDAAGEKRGVLVMLSDITEAKTAGETGAKFVSSFSHDLKTPLTSIQMTIHLLLEDVGRMTPRQVEFLQAARDDAHRLHSLIEEMVAAVRARL